MGQKYLGFINTYSRVLLALTWAVFIFMLLSARMPVSDVYVFTWYDKFTHSFLFAVLAYFLFKALFFGLEAEFDKSALISIIATVFYIIAMEFLQNFFPGRTPDLLDTIFGIFGVSVAILYFHAFYHTAKPKLLLHICCMGCGLHVIGELKQKLKIDLFFYNPNIYPEAEYANRLADAVRIAKEFRLKLIEGDYVHDIWRMNIKGHELEKEGGKRCRKCYQVRMEKTARYAKENNYRYFTTTLSISPHKETAAINQAGRQAARKYGIEFLPEDFKLNEGFKKSSELSRQFSVYRQKYCGCEYSDTFKKSRVKKNSSK